MEFTLTKPIEVTVDPLSANGLAKSRCDRLLIGMYALSYRKLRIQPKFKATLSRKRLRKLSRAYGRRRLKYMTSIDGTPLPPWFTVHDVMKADLRILQATELHQSPPTGVIEAMSYSAQHTFHDYAYRSKITPYSPSGEK